MPIHKNVIMNSRFARHGRGYSLLEVLVTVFVLSVGLLGIAALFLSTLLDSRIAIQRSKATAFATDMIERMRANRSAAESYASASPASHNCRTTKDAAASTCSPAALAAHDLYEWNTTLADPLSGLPEGRGEIRRTASAPPTYTVEVSWRDGANATTHSIQVVTQL